MKLRDAIIERIKLADYLTSAGSKVTNTAGDEMISCPLHKDANPSCSIDHDKGLWHCFSCNEGGTVIDLHMRLAGLSVKDAMFDLAEKHNIPIDDTPHKVETYEYKDKIGRPVMMVDRIEKGKRKKFRQYHSDKDGKEVNGIEGVGRVLYRLEKWHGKEDVALCEGEKCVHALEATGTLATTNPGGSSGWLSAYAEMLSGKRVEIWPDNDEAGERWLDEVMASLAGKVKAVKIMRVPKEYNDFADVMDAKGIEFATDMLTDIAEKNDWIDKGVVIDLLSSEEAYEIYRKRVSETESVSIDFAKWLPSFHSYTRPMMPGDLVAVLADTGVGKTAVLANIAYSQRPLPVIFFEIELSPEAMTERFIARDLGMETLQVERDVKAGIRHNVGDWSHVYLCPNSRITTESMRSIILQSELKIGRKPALVMVDYIGLVTGGSGKKYERMSQIAEDMKVMARETNTVIVMASQVKRQDDRTEVGLHDGRDTSSIENSAQLILGIWRPTTETMTVKILKQTRVAGTPQIECLYHGNKQKIVELKEGYAETTKY
jgi:KaiC/GvpD/RAD55 family RecA-like ATPase